ncbi:MAG: NAD(P)/FAD-dependent oxidoreductase [Dehalococcoidia bacterium]|nr:MAG: NAD(P)/FAD-dependent oxidoreductase [Dehalococcoidia bacterium]
MHNDVVVVGGGIAGLTAAAFLAKSGRSVLLLEKSEKVGGCINSFERSGFVFDGGIRALENSGVLFTMLKQLGIEIEFVKNNVSIGLEKDVVRLEGMASLADYEGLLRKYFPGNAADVKKVFTEIEKVSNYMDVVYGIDNPLFLDMKKDRKYLVTVILPWLLKYLLTTRKIEKLKEPIKHYLSRITANTSLIDIFAQHFFKDTPAFFALGYLKIYLDYYYPRGGTQILPDKLRDFITQCGGRTQNKTEVTEIDLQQRRLLDQSDNSYNYKRLVWAADLKTLYNIISVDSIADSRVKADIISRKQAISDKTGGDSIFALYLCLDLDKKFFSDIATEHFFYTPYSRGLLQASTISVSGKEETIKCLEDYFKYNTYETACPVLRDSNLAPNGKTGLIISTLFDYSVTRKISEDGWYDEFKRLSEDIITDVFNQTIYPGIKDKIISRFSSTPLTLFNKHGNSQGAITGWGFDNREMPAETRLSRISRSIKTPIPDVFQAGQWSFSPSGLPVSIITGKLAADAARKSL